MESPEEFLPKKGNYRRLLVYQKAECIYDITFYFAHKYMFDRIDRTVDQMVQSARSGKQNIAEGNAAASTSSETEIKLIGVARASMKELLTDYEDYLRVRGTHQPERRRIMKPIRPIRPIRPIGPIRPISPIRLISLLAALFFLLPTQAQIKIGGNVYGGGNAGDMTGSTEVTVYAGDINGSVYGGARQANVGGSSFVNIDGEHMSEDILINKVYGGNDISGTIGSAESVPTELTEAAANGITPAAGEENAGKNTKKYNAFVLTTPERKVDTSQPYSIFIGQLFGGGNGDYDYTSETLSDNTKANPYYGKTSPELSKTYLELRGGTFGYVYGGGNNATVTAATYICIDNSSEVTTESNGIYFNFKDGDTPGVIPISDVSSISSGDENSNDQRLMAMGINLSTYKPGKHFLRVFGGNNKADMAIRPTWHLKKGSIVNLYSGGNEGRMTSPQGLLLEIGKKTDNTIETSDIIVENVFGGCRKSDVFPSNDGSTLAPQVNNITGYNFPNNLAARVLVRSGKITNVYGGNDISGKVYFGNAVGVYTSISGNIYGGGNGSYAYTDNADLKDNLIWGDFYYNPDDILSKEEVTVSGLSEQMQSVEALNLIRPNAEQVSIRVAGTDAAHPTIIGGAVYMGGNSATLKSTRPNPMVELKIGSHVIADKVFLGNNGENMVKSNEKDDANGISEGVLRTMASTSITSNSTKFNSINLTDADVFAKYMDGCAMSLVPSVVFDNADNGDPANYEAYSTYIGSLYCGGNVGSMKRDGKETINFNHKVIIYDKLVGGCNSAYVPPTTYNAEYDGGLLGDADSNGDKLELNLSGLRIMPKRWKMKIVNDKEEYDLDDNGNRQLEWNTWIGDTKSTLADATTGTASNDDKNRRFKGGNIYGGCYTSGHIEGNVIININSSIVERGKSDLAEGEVDHGVFDSVKEDEIGEAILYNNTDYTITKRRSGVILDEQGMDVLGSALNVFGGGKGKGTEIWGSTTINVNEGYAFQIFGGSEEGAIGKGTRDANHELVYNTDPENNNYSYDAKYSTTINLHGTLAGHSRHADDPNATHEMAEAEFIYGGGFEGLVCGDTHINLGNGRLFNSFAGSCNADILGHTETYVGQWRDKNGTTVTGFPWIRDHIYGGNDLGGSIKGYADFTGRIRNEVESMVHGGNKPKATTYMEYTQGRVKNILGGCYGNYDYSDAKYSSRIANTGKPYLHNAFVNFRPVANAQSEVAKLFGAGEGYADDRDGDKSQDHSYVLVDIPEGIETFKTTEVFGAGAYDGLGMRYPAAETFADDFDPIEASAVIDLMRGRISAAYGGSLDEGVTRRTEVNVPAGSTIKVNNIFGGAYGNHILPPCDVYEANVNYRSGNARVNGGIYGGNNHVRRTIYATVNISVPVLKENGYNGTVYGAGKGLETWAEYTEVNLESGANVYEVYGGSEMGNVLNAESVEAYMKAYAPKPADKLLTEDETEWKNANRWTGVVGKSELTTEYKTEWQKVWKTAWTVGDYYTPNADYDDYVNNQHTNLTNAAFVRTAEMDDRDYTDDTEKAKRQYKYNTNVIINEGATVGGYVYGGGLGDSKTPLSGGIYGSTYVAVLGGTVAKDVYAAGTSGSVSDVFSVGAYSESNQKGFTATANVYVKGGTVRNVYGGGWEGHVGHHEGAISASTSGDKDGETHVVVGVRGDDDFLTGAPAVTRNVYGGGEGGSVYGKAYVTVNNGHIGYRYVNGEYKEELDDKEPGDNALDQGGNVFGGGYVVNSYTDASDITMWGGQVRGCLYGGGELGPIGRGTTLETASTDNAFINGPAKIYKGGETHVTLYGGHVMRNVFGGGRGFDNWNGDGTMFMSQEVKESLDLSSKGYVFGSTDVHIRGGEIGTHADVAHGLEVGNVFGGGNQGFVYSATGTKHGVRKTQALSEMTNGLPTDGGGYYYSKWIGDQGVEDDHSKCQLSLDCNVVVEPYCLVTAVDGISGFTTSADGIVKSSYAKGEYVPVEALNQLLNRESDATRWDKIDWKTGVTIHNAVFAGGNVTTGSDQMYVNTGTVFGNVTAALRDVYNRDLITIGTEHTGGIYGDGNLTMVDGWREIHIDNYGTDYYTMETEIDKEVYETMSDRERAYFVLNYKTLQEITDTKSGILAANKRMTLDEIKTAFDFDNYHNSGYPEDYKNYISADGTPNPTYFKEMGFCSIYAGRLLNTIQRCDMVAVWGSRIVLQGARDRVPEKADYTRYTLNRVGELSLNQRKAENTSEPDENKKHGNYFGIYSVVNYLGNLTSDVFFTDEDVSKYDNDYSSIRTTDNANSNNAADGKTTYYDWKMNHIGKANRNNATSPNKVCLASGVYLELIREESEKSDKREWGLITGVVELDLIDVKTGLGGGYVYARNQHGTKEWHRNWSKVNLSPYNLEARTYKRFTYTETPESNLKEFETSGNFVHNTKQIIDDCYPNANAYVKSQTPYSEAHYWYIRGSIYVYDQYISAYTGTANAYATTVNIPLTITAASHGRMTLRDVQPNRYAYYDDDGKPLGTEGTVIVGDITYHAGDPIDYWTYSTLSEKDQAHFVKNVYNTIAECQVNGTTYPEGSVLLPTEVETLKDQAQKEIDGKTVASVYHVEQQKDVPFDYVFRVANKISHDAGFALTYDVNNPSVWNNYYTLTNSPSTHKNTEEYDALTNVEKAQYTEGPTYHAVTPGVYGQHDYEKGEIISKGVYDAYQSIGTALISQLPNQQATAEPAYVITSEWTGKNKDKIDQHLYEGTPVFESDYEESVWSGMPKSQATLCTSTLQLSETEYVYAGDLLSTDKLDALKTRLKKENSWTDTEVTTYLNNYLSDAYYITKAGKYGGRYYNAGEAYRALDAWCSLSETDRENFRYNYDGLDLLIDDTYGGDYGFKPQYDGYKPVTPPAAIKAATTPEQIKALAQYDECTPLNPNLYSKTQPIDYEAEFNPNDTHITELGDHYDNVNHKLTYTNENNVTVSISTGYNNRIKSTAFEDIPNERAHWSPIIVTDPGTYYVVKEAFINGDLPYTVGQQIDEALYNSLSETNKKKIRRVDIPDTEDYVQYNSTTEKYNQLYYYYCRESYKIGEKGEGTGFHAETNNKDYTVGETVDADIIIKSSEYDKLVNLQKGFIIHGTAPIETSTLYVSRETDIFDLQKEKIITVIYLYEYQESDESGNNITPISERHIMNIHINFESGAPEIGPLTPPGVVLPGTTVGLKLPRVEPGAFEISSSGWEIFDNVDNATLHVGGKPYINNATPMYWYQNGYWVAYYAQTYLGKTYSEPVQFTVANYHDLKKVMDDKEHHYYIDHKDVDREPKIYINDYSQDETGDKNGLDLFHDLMELTHGNSVDGHDPLTLNNPGKPIKNAQFLEFFLRADQDHGATTEPNPEYEAEPNPEVPETITVDHPWTPIANGVNECFSGVFHGDGHTITGLDHSLFNQLCGDVYNLGVTGSFTGAGIAETGEGYVENCWISSSSTKAKTSKPIFGSPTGDDESRPKRIVNSYYLEDDDAATTAATDDGTKKRAYENHTGSTYGIPTRMSAQNFYNGTVAYDLNGFYLYKRYSDKTVTSGTDNNKYDYYTIGTDGKLNKTEGYYDDYDSGRAQWCSEKYVEHRFEDGDFRYAGGTIPETEDVRTYTDEEGKPHFYPIWPDDYLFFGQTLTYGYDDTRAHQDVPSAINRSGNRLQTDASANRVYRAPAYYRNNTMGMAHFNPAVNLAAYSKPKFVGDTNLKPAYPNMTAIDFKGHNDATYTLGRNDNWFYQPLLDDDGITSIANRDETKNLLVYAPSIEENEKTFNVLDVTFVEPAFSTYYSDDKYSKVRVAPTQPVQGHLVLSTLTADRDHLLVDKQDFNAPIDYTFDDSHRMWYQRTPDNYVTTTFTGGEKTTLGWEGISLPFSAELVSTQDKGEITHFYSGSKFGHEYWLREFATGGQIDGNVYKANFNALSDGNNTKDYTNTFLWEYYYSHDDYKDKNEDLYQNKNNVRDRYYSAEYLRGIYPVNNYPFGAAGTPYLVGFPGKTYFEFDLSGEWKPEHTFEDISSPGKQTITFASATGANIKVSDDETARVTPPDDYTFVPTYLNKSFEAAGTNNYYVLASDGGSYDKVPAEGDATPVVAFRPYFTGPVGGGAKSRQVAERIVFSSNDDSAFNFDENDPTEEEVDGTLTIYTKKGIIGVTSSLRSDTEVVIVNTGGLTIGAFTIKPGETIETPVPTTGIYLFRAAGGRYNKKISVK